MSLTPVTDHVERGTSLLIEQYRGRPRIESLLRSYLLQVQELSDATWDVMVSRLIDTAVDEQLTVLSRLVGMLVRVEDDEVQRVLVSTRIAVNSSRGRGDDIARTASLALSARLKVTDFRYLEHPPAGVLIVVTEPASGIVPTLEHDLIDLAAAGGVRVDLYYSDDEPSEWFNFGTGPGWGEGVFVGSVTHHEITGA